MQQKGFMMTRKRFKKLMYSLGYQRNSINQWISQFRKETASDSRSYLFYYLYYPYLHYRENLDHFFESEKALSINAMTYSIRIVIG